MSQNLYTQHTSHTSLEGPAHEHQQSRETQPATTDETGDQAQAHHTPTPHEIYGNLKERTPKRMSRSHSNMGAVDPYAHARRQRSHAAEPMPEQTTEDNEGEQYQQSRAIYGAVHAEPRRPFHAKNHRSSKPRHPIYHKSHEGQAPAQAPAPHSLVQDQAILERFKQLMDPNGAEETPTVTSHVNGSISSDAFHSNGDAIFAEERILKNGSSASHGGEVKVMIRRRRTIVRPENEE